MEPYNYTSDVMNHKKLVKDYLDGVALHLAQRGIKHDDSKFEPEERETYERVIPVLRTMEYGTQEYEETKQQLGSALDHHYQHNDHHIEYFENGIRQMDLFQLMEWLCDQMAAARRSPDGDFWKSLEIARKHYGISDQLYNILENTIITLRDMG